MRARTLRCLHPIELERVLDALFSSKWRRAFQLVRCAVRRTESTISSQGDRDWTAAEETSEEDSEPQRKREARAC